MALVLIAAMAMAEIQTPLFTASDEQLRTYILTACEGHPELQKRYAEWRAAIERVPQAKSLDDPMLSFGYFLQSDMNNYKISLKQKFPAIGVLRERGDKAMAEADAALARFYSQKNLIIANIKTVYYNYAFLAEQMSVVESQKEILDDMESIVRQKYSLGMAPEYEMVRVQIAQEKLRDMNEQLAQSRAPLMAKLNDAIGRDITTGIPLPKGTFNVERVSHEAQTEQDIQIVMARIRASNPDLTELENMIAARDSAVTLAEKQRSPNITAGIDYGAVRNKKMSIEQTPTGPMMTARNADENFMFSISINVPIWRKRIKAAVSEAEQLKDATRNAKRRKTLALNSMAEKVLFHIQDAKRRLSLYTDSLLPKAEQAYEGLLSGYAADTGADFTLMLDSVNILLEFELEQARAMRDFYTANAELEYLTGGAGFPGANPE